MSFPRSFMLRAACAALIALAPGVVQVQAQGAFPAPLPGAANNAQPSPFPPVNGAPAQPAAAPASSSPFPPVNGAPASAPASQSAFPSGGAAPLGGGMTGGGFGQPPQPGGGAGAGAGAACMAEFKPLRDETEKRGKAIRSASERKASAQEACGLIQNFSQAELKLIKYVTTNQQRCGIPPDVSSQLKQGHANTDKMLKQVCNAAKQQAAGGGGGAPPAPSLSEALGSVSVPEANAGARRSGGSTFDTLNGNVLSR